MDTVLADDNGQALLAHAQGESQRPAAHGLCAENSDAGLPPAGDRLDDPVAAVEEARMLTSERLAHFYGLLTGRQGARRERKWGKAPWRDNGKGFAMAR